MNRRLSTKDAIAFTRKQNEQYIKAAAFIEPLIEVVEKFDGKVVNVKLERAVKEISPDIRFYRTSGMAGFEMWVRDYYTKEDGRSESLDFSTVNIMHFNMSNGETPDFAFYQNNGECRLNGPAVIERLKQMDQSIRNKVAAIELELDNIEAKIAEYKGLKEQIRKFNRETSYTISENFGFAKLREIA